MSKKRSVGLVTITLITLTGCSATQDPATTEPAATPSETTTATNCLEITPDAIAGLQWGLDQKQDNITVERGAAIATDDYWIVAGLITGPGLEEGHTAIWSTFQDPTTTGEFAYSSIDAVAAEFSAYEQPEGGSLAWPNAEESLDCLD